jgi:hypothetical protein
LWQKIIFHRERADLGMKLFYLAILVLSLLTLQHQKQAA